MFTLLKRKSPVLATVAIPPPRQGWTAPETAASLLATPRREKLLEHIWQRTSLSRAQFGKLYRTPLERYAELVQLLPASESHHHAYPGGMLDHGLEIVAYALKLRQSRLLPAGTTPEEQAEQSEAWTTATAYAALLHDIGKLAVDLHVELEDGSVWHPWQGPMRQSYRFRYRKDREYRLHGAATGLIHHQILDRGILDWLSGFGQVWPPLLYVLAGQYEHAGALGELVVQADRASVAQELGGDPARAMAAPKHALQRKLLDGLRYLLKEELKLNQPQASDGWLTDDDLWLVSKTVSDKLRAHLLSQGFEGIPANNTAVFTVLQDHGILHATPEGKAIWKATVTSDGGWTHTFTLLKLSPALIWESAERPPAFTGSVTIVAGEEDVAGGSTTPQIPSPMPEDGSTPAPSAMLAHSPTEPIPAMPQPDGAIDELLGLIGLPDDDPVPGDDMEQAEKPEASRAGEPVPVFQDSESEAPTAATIPAASGMQTPSGEHFVAWLRSGIDSHKIVINDAKARVHTVADTVLLVSPGLFQRYVMEHPQVGTLAKQEQIRDLDWVQKRFEKLQLHRRQPSGLNIWTCEVTGPRKARRLHGYLLKDPRILFDDVPPNNPYLAVL
ncbi:MobH family relaxase [Shinella sp.]|uniref:MobH family relaxase n=1 Tax=Shinella sp. TaxID=1870904 RepID=UPI00258AA758|nr:MobH family relaxase [Shinella sp.]MCW5706966.1 TraI domain-containing protein [Shinella sp.]